MTRGQRVGLVLGGALGLFIAYEVATSFVAYTSDAYVRSDLVAVAPEVTGRIVAVHVTDNQPVRRDDMLANIDPVPFQLAIAQQAAAIQEARALADADQDETAAAQDQLQSAQSALTFAQATRDRVAALVTSSDVSRQQLDQANNDARRAEAAMAGAAADLAGSKQRHAMHLAGLARAEADMAVAQWRLSRTDIKSPTDGTVTNLTVRVGDTATVDMPLIGIVDSHAWRIMANYKESYIRGFNEGGTAWVWLDSEPWHFHRARIGGVSRGISREPDEMKLLPYIAPTTDWIRLQRRFPVTLFLVDPPPKLTLYMGADAHVVIFPVTAIGDGIAKLGTYAADLGRDILATRFTGDRAQFATATALSVVLAVTLSQLAHLDDPWWAGISGMMASQATRPASIARVTLRIAGTIAGSGLGYVAIGLFAYDHVALCLFIFAAATIGLIGFSVSPHGYAWMLGGLTANLVVMMAMIDPTQAPYIVFDRVAQVTLGCFAALVVALALRPDGGPAATAAPGWRDLFGAGWPAVQHAVRSGIAVMLMPILWTFLDLPSMSQMAITATAVLAVPIRAGGNASLVNAIAERAVLRTMGCLLGGLFGLFLIGLPLTSYPLWLAVLFGGVWLFTYVQSSPAAISYVGLQAAIVLVITLVQGRGPPTTLLPGIERLVGILGGVAVLAIVNFALWPSSEETKRTA